MNEINSEGEKLRLAALKEFQILDTLPERDFDDITLLASQICETPIALVSLIDEDRQWFKSRVGLEAAETEREYAFCSHAIEGDELFVVPDAAEDLRFQANPLVTGDPHIRFYAGAPLTTSDGYKLGTLCVIDRKPRRLSESQERAMNALARSVMTLIEARGLKESANSAKDEKRANVFSVNDESRSRKKSFFDRYVKHYIIATLIIAAVTLIKWFLGSIGEYDLFFAPFLLFVSAVILSAWRGGFGPGLYATFVTVLIIDFWLMPTGGNLLNHNFTENLSLLVYIAQGIFISALCASRLRNERLLHKAGKDLENRISKRTAQLAQANDELRQEIQERNLLQEDLRRARDSALESARLKSEFLANMSHEIRTPMNGVIGMTGLLLETKLDDEQKRFAHVIRTSGESLLTIINDILDFSKVEAGKLELETLDFDLRETIESLVEMFSSRAREQCDELAALIHSDVPLLVRGDAGRIRQILTNLISNAIKFTRYGDVLVRVEKLRESSDRVELKFSIADTGEGISDEVQARLFQPFTQSDASTTRRFGGTGLGLSISKRLVEMMHGEIGLESKAGKGSTFWFKITLEKQNGVSHCETERKTAAQDHLELGGKRVLIVDDNHINREVLVYQARSWGMETVESADGMTAIDLFEKSDAPFDLIILDLQMPVMDGLETAREFISKKRPSPPIIMISSGSFKMNDRKMHELGIKAFLTKPYRQRDLLEAVCRNLDVHRDEIVEDDDIHITATVEKVSEPLAKSKRILVVEDNSVNQLVAQNMLKKFGYQSDVAANGREALEALELVPYDLILMDCQMPEMDGYEATRQVRARDWEAARTPIIALTAHATDGEREKCLQAGMDDYISKPVEKETLRQTVAHWIAKSEDKNMTDLNNKLNENAAQTPVSAVDFATLDDITDNDEAMKREVVEIYLQQTVVNLAEIERAISINDANKLYELAHKTVGGSALCGMTAIVAPMRKLEQMGREGRADEALPFFAEAQNAFAAIDRECRENILIN